jgi:hypothetical protein
MGLVVCTRQRGASKRHQRSSYKTEGAFVLAFAVYAPSVVAAQFRFVRKYEYDKKTLSKNL